MMWREPALEKPTDSDTWEYLLMIKDAVKLVSI